MKTSEEGIKLIKHFEGIRNRPYKCSARVWTIGVVMLFMTLNYA
jgi:GH24 family phage-related lysozyme (muramidase)